nr:lipoprotein yajI [Raoultella sp. NCTC 9187]
MASGQISGTTESYREVNVRDQLISAPASILAPSDVDIPLRLSGVTPEQLGFVRIHDIQPADAQ